MKKLLFFALALFTAQSSLAQWGPDVRLTNTDDTSSINNFGRGRNIAANGDTINVVWTEKIDGEYDIFYLRSTDEGVSWSTPIRLTNDPPGSGGPSVSASGSVVHVVYTSRKTGNHEIYYRRSIDGGTNWEEEQRLTDDVAISYGPTISVSGSYIHSVWVNNDPDEYTWKIFYRCSEDGGINWGPEYWLSPNSTMAYNVSIAAYSSEVHVAWNGNNIGESAKIYYRKSIDSGSTWETEIRLSNTPSILPSIAASGTSINIAWTDYRNGSTATDIFFIGSIDGGNSWGQEIQVTSDSTSLEWPNIAVSDSVLHLVWQDNRSGYYDIYYNYSIDGGETWNEDTQLNDWSYISERPFIAISDTVLHVIWRDYRDGNYEIYYKRNPPGNLFGINSDLVKNTRGQVSIYPNPASRQLTVDSGAKRSPERSEGSQSAVSSQQSAIRLSIIDLYGHEIKEFKDISSFPYTIDISGLRNGLYFLRVTGEEGETGSAKFLKMAE